MRLSNDEAAAMGKEIYESIRAKMEAEHWGRLVVIDVHSGDYEVGDYHGSRSDLELTMRLRERRPDAFTWAELVGAERYIAASFGYHGPAELSPVEKRSTDD